MLETPNTTTREIYPVTMLPHGDDGKLKPFHVIHCLAQPHCDAELKLSPGGGARLPPNCLVKFAAQKGWFADRRGYALCPVHRPGSKLKPPSDMSPAQKRAAFMAIRDRDIGNAAAQMMKPTKPVGAVAKHTAKVRAAVAKAVEAQAAENPDLDVSGRLDAFVKSYRGYQWADGPDAKSRSLTDLEARMFAFIAAHPNRVWRSRRSAAVIGGFNPWTFNAVVRSAIAARLVVEELVRPPAVRPFRLRLVDQFDPPAMQPETQEESAPMPPSAAFEAEAVPVSPGTLSADPPRSPSLEHNRTIRDFLDSHFDEAAGRWKADWSDAKAADRLLCPRAWVSSLRSALYGPDDRNEASEAAQATASALEQAATALKDDALAIATRAEALEREVRKFLDGRA
jgi:hypothetical protein